MTSVLIEQQVGIETVTHYASRDRNLLGMLSDLLGASAVGLMVYPQTAGLEYFEISRSLARPQQGQGGYAARVGRWLKESF